MIELYSQETSLAITKQVNKPTQRLRCVTACRTLVGLFNWLGYESNLAKMYDKQPEKKNLKTHYRKKRRNNTV
jgi:hypothetical protein